MRYSDYHSLHRLAHKGKHVHGFTLLELLVVMSILALIMTASFGAVRLGSKSFEAGITRADRTEQVRATADFLRRQFAQLAPIVHQDDAQAVISFSGDHETIRFIGPAPQSEKNAGLYIYLLATEGRYNQQSLMLAYTPYDPGNEAIPEMQDALQMTLVEQLSEARFEFYGANHANENPAWYNAWDSAQQVFPQMVRIHLAPAQDGISWPPMTFAIHAEGTS